MLTAWKVVNQGKLATRGREREILIKNLINEVFSFNKEEVINSDQSREVSQQSKYVITIVLSTYLMIWPGIQILPMRFLQWLTKEHTDHKTRPICCVNSTRSKR